MATKKSSAPEERDESASQLISQRIADLGDWRGETLGRVRALIQEADPDIVEEWKWGNPVWSHGGIVCTGETYKSAVKMTFARGAFVKDPSGLFNSSLEGNLRRAIDIKQGEKIKEAALKTLIRAAVALNAGGKKAAAAKSAVKKAASKNAASKKAAPKRAPSKKVAPKRAARGPAARR